MKRESSNPPAAMGKAVSHWFSSAAQRLVRCNQRPDAMQKLRVQVHLITDDPGDKVPGPTFQVRVWVAV